MADAKRGLNKMSTPLINKLLATTHFFDNPETLEDRVLHLEKLIAAILYSQGASKFEIEIIGGFSEDGIVSEFVDELVE